MPEKQKRIRNLSTRWLWPFKLTMFGVYGMLFTYMVFYLLHEHILSQLFVGTIMSIAFMQLIKEAVKIKRVEFDNEFLYVIRNSADILIPLENIESVEISSLGGVYKVNLYSQEQLGKEFYFKPSLLYPLNYKKKDALVNLLRSNIEASKKRRNAFPVNALTS